MSDEMYLTYDVLRCSVTSFWSLSLPHLVSHHSHQLSRKQLPINNGTASNHTLQRCYRPESAECACVSWLASQEVPYQPHFTPPSSVRLSIIPQQLNNSTKTPSHHETSGRKVNEQNAVHYSPCRFPLQLPQVRRYHRWRQQVLRLLWQCELMMKTGSSSFRY